MHTKTKILQQYVNAKRNKKFNLPIKSIVVPFSTVTLDMEAPKSRRS